MSLIPRKKIDEAPAAAPQGAAHEPETKQPGAALVASSRDALPDYLREAAVVDAGMGVSTDQADNIIPLIYVMHPLSPQVDEGSAAHVPGARPGSIWLRNSATPMIDKDVGILVQPCEFWKDFVEWIPRTSGGGFVARHPVRMATAADVARFKTRLGDKIGGLLVEGEDIPDVEDAIFKIDPANRQKAWSRPNGDDLILTRNHAVRVMAAPGVGLPYVIPMKGASHAVSKGWMGKMLAQRAGNALLPAFACLWRLTTEQRKNAKGTWYQFKVSDDIVGYPTPDDYRAGRDLCLAFRSGAKVAEAEVEAGDAGGGGGDGNGGAGAGGAHDEHIPF